MEILKKHGWKVLAILFLFYVAIVGLGTPLSPGILKVEPETLQPGMNEDVRVHGYNTQFDEGKTPELWVEVGDETLCGRDLEVESSSELSTDIFVPSGLSHDEIVLYLSTQNGGNYLLPDAFFIEEGDPEQKAPKTDCSPERYGSVEAFDFPFRKILYETIRNLYFHVPMWFGMMGLMFLGFFHSIVHLRNGSLDADLRSKAFVHAGLLLAILGLATGSMWARFTWGTWWVSDPKLNGAAVTTLIYFAYMVLRNSLRDPEQRGRISAVYNIFAFVLLLVFLLILPRMAQESLHPGSGGNPAFSRYDLDDNMRTVFYPAVIGWFLLGLWIARVRIRMERVKERMKRL
jgi:heme exporter protein C